jgi:hypothetical protein
MKVFVDCEFVDDGLTIDLISIGMVREDGAELYRINGDREGKSIHRAVCHDWLRENVVPYLPVTVHDSTEVDEHGVHLRTYPTPDVRHWFEWNKDHPDFSAVKPTVEIAEDVRRFIVSTPKVELWAWYSAYDHVALAQLFGSMQDLPEGVPMCTFDLKQEHVRLGSPVLPRQQGGEHNALADARHNQMIARFLDKHLLSLR